jgi:hypothetical protein
MTATDSRETTTLLLREPPATVTTSHRIIEAKPRGTGGWPIKLLMS